MVGGLVGITVSSILTLEWLNAWGWRIPFLISLVLIPIALYIRRALPETLEEPTHHSGTQMITIIFSRYRTGDTGNYGADIDGYYRSAR